MPAKEVIKATLAGLLATAVLGVFIGSRNLQHFRLNGFLGGDESVVWPAGIASAFCLALNLGLLQYLYPIEEPA